MSGLADVAKKANVKREVVQDVFEAILSMVKNGDDVRIKGFGTFERKTYPGRTLQTPAVNEGKPIKFADSFLLKFRQSALAKRRLNTKSRKGKKKK